MQDKMIELYVKGTDLAARGTDALKTFRSEKGQGSVEYLGIIIVVVALIGAIFGLAQTEWGKAISQAIQAQITKLSELA